MCAAAAVAAAARWVFKRHHLLPSRALPASSGITDVTRRFSTAEDKSDWQIDERAHRHAQTHTHIHTHHRRPPARVNCRPDKPKSNVSEIRAVATFVVGDLIHTRQAAVWRRKNKSHWEIVWFSGAECNFCDWRTWFPSSVWPRWGITTAEGTKCGPSDSHCTIRNYINTKYVIKQLYVIFQCFKNNINKELNAVQL